MTKSAEYYYCSANVLTVPAWRIVQPPSGHLHLFQFQQFVRELTPEEAAALPPEILSTAKPKQVEKPTPFGLDIAIEL